MKTPAQAIREELKIAFPTIKFSVRKDGYSCVNIRWTDGPTQSAVNESIGKYKMGNFDGMTDSYDYSNRRDDIPQVQYIFTHRERSEELAAAEWEITKECYGLDGGPQDWYHNFNMYGREIVWASIEGNM